MIQLAWLAAVAFHFYTAVLLAGKYGFLGSLLAFVFPGLPEVAYLVYALVTAQWTYVGLFAGVTLLLFGSAAGSIQGD